MEGSCHCGTVRFEVAAPPTRAGECNCSICWKLGTLWSYYHPRDVRFLSGLDQTLAYVWGDRTLSFHTCRTCGCTTHWQALDPARAERMGVNARLLPVFPGDVEVHHIDCGEHGRFWIR
ncbi:MAG TPA: GFA family protein [Pseudomonadales bacterium]